MTLIDSVTSPVTINTKPEMIQRLIVAEVIGKRVGPMEQLRKGLGKCGILSVCQKYPEKCLELYGG